MHQWPLPSATCGILLYCDTNHWCNTSPALLSSAIPILNNRWRRWPKDLCWAGFIQVFLASDGTDLTAKFYKLAVNLLTLFRQTCASPDISWPSVNTYFLNSIIKFMPLEPINSNASIVTHWLLSHNSIVFLKKGYYCFAVDMDWSKAVIKAAGTLLHFLIYTARL